MKQVVNLLPLLLLLWTCSCQNKQTEAYLQNLAEENATLMEVIRLKNQELEQLSARLQQLETAPATAQGQATPQQGKTLVRQSLAASVTKKTDSLSEQMVISSGYPAAALKPKQTPAQVNPARNGKQPKHVEQSLNQLSDPAIELTTRKAWKKDLLLAFANGSVEVFAEKKGFVNRYTAATLLDLLLYFPHQVKVSKVVKNTHDQIIHLRLQLHRQHM